MVREMVRQCVQVIREFSEVARELTEVTLDGIRPRFTFDGDEVEGKEERTGIYRTRTLSVGMILSKKLLFRAIVVVAPHHHRVAPGTQTWSKRGATVVLMDDFVVPLSYHPTFRFTITTPSTHAMLIILKTNGLASMLSLFSEISTNSPYLILCLFAASVYYRSLKIR